MGYPRHANETGAFQELLRRGDTEIGQISLLTIQPGCERGNHWHGRKTEWFCCVEGEATLELDDVDTGTRSSLALDSLDVAFLRVDPRVAHKVVNRGKGPAKVVIVISEPYDPKDPDTFPFLVRGGP